MILAWAKNKHHKYRYDGVYLMVYQMFPQLVYFWNRGGDGFSLGNE